MMMKPTRDLLIHLALLCAFFVLATFAGPNRPFPQHTTYASGSILPSVGQATLDSDVETFYNYWKQTYVSTSTVNGQFRARVIDNSQGGNGGTVSEGMGYGMIIVVMMAGYDPDAQTIFDGMFNYARAYPVPGAPNLMIWQIDSSGTTSQSDSAFDGDADIAYALILADAQWGSSGTINYAAEALATLEDIANYTIGANSLLPELGNWVPDATHTQYTPRSSDFMYGHFRAYSRFQTSQSSFWTSVLQACENAVDQIQANEGSVTGLLPDFMVYSSSLGRYQPAPSNFLESSNDGSYYYNAGRDPWRIGVDWLLNGNQKAYNQVTKISNWVANNAGNNGQNIRPGYTLSGTPIDTSYFSSFFASPLGVAAMLQSSQQTWLDSIYNAVKNNHDTYYEDTVTMICMIIMSGNYWDPTANSSTGGSDGSDGGAAELYSWVKYTHYLKNL
jgi:endo-1,4-beta-D-glucanase Y